MNTESFRKLALAFDGATESPHFQLVSFRANKNIFATMDIENNRVMIKLTPIDQSLFIDGVSIYPVPNLWGAKGATYFDLEKVRTNLIEDALQIAYRSVRPGRSSPK